MDRLDLQALFALVAEGKTSPAEAAAAWTAGSQGEVEIDLGFARVDPARAARTGTPEVVWGQHKPADQIVGILRSLAAAGRGALATRVDPAKAAEVQALWPVGAAPALTYDAVAQLVVVAPVAAPPARGQIAIVVAGTSDLPVAREAELTAQFLGATVAVHVDVGVAGIHRLFARLPQIRAADVVIVIAGMEGALPSVVAGLVRAPVIAVPTSVGYGVGAGGWAALAGMLTACAPGLAVVNIDNGFGAAALAHRMLAVGAPAEPR